MKHVSILDYQAAPIPSSSPTPSPQCAIKRIKVTTVKSKAQDQTPQRSGFTEHTTTPIFQRTSNSGESLDECVDLASRKAWLKRSFLPAGLVSPTLEGFQVIVRFCISRFYLDGVWVKVEAAQRTSKDVWKLRAEVEFYVLEHTGEMLGTELREDWARFILTKTDIDDVVKTKDNYEFPAGLARSFKGDRRIARRAVLSSCVAER